MDIAHRGGELMLLSLGRCVFSLLLLILLLPICSCLLLQLQSEQEAAAARDYLRFGYLRCMGNATSLSTTFTRNLDAALQNLTKIASQGSKYANTTAGSGTTDMVYAMFQCRGDQTLELCSECMRNATARLPQSDCPDYVGARIQLDGCYLRYDSQSFFMLDSSYVGADCFENTSDPVAMATIKDVVGNVTTLAPQQGGFASARASGQYAMAQCLGYLSESECSRCLLAHNNYSSVCESTLGATIYMTSCYYRFEPYSFLEPLPPPPPPPLPLPSAPPPLASTSLAPKPQGSKTAIIAAGVVVGVVILTAILCAIVVWRYKSSRIKGVKLVGRDASWPRQLLQPKAQVFSLQELEEATGQFHATSKLGAGGFGVVYKVWENYQQGKSLDLVDEKLASAFSPEQAMRVVHAALLCTQENPKERPAMSMVTFWLSGTPAILEVPTRPIFLNYIGSILPRGDVNHPFTSTSSSSSQSSRSGGQVSRFPGQAQSFSEIVVRT